MRRAITLCSAISLLLLFIPRAAAATQVIQVQAYVDGRSQLILHGDTARWHHLDWAAPGREVVPFEPPYAPTIINGTEWYPQWPDIPNPYNSWCHCYSDVFTGVNPPVPQTDVHVWLTPVQARGPVSIVQMPTSADDHTLVVQFDDDALSGAAWYTVDVNLAATDTLGVAISWGPASARVPVYSNGPVGLTSGDYAIDPATGHVASIIGTGTIPGRVGGDATVTFSVTYDPTASGYAGTFDISDPGAGFTAHIPVHAGRFQIQQEGSTVMGTLYGIKVLSTPKKCFMILFEIDDLG